MSPIQRILKVIGESPFWRVVGRLHAAVYRATGGRLGGSAGGIKNLLLTTTGRKSGQPRTVTLAYIEDARRYVVVASNGGSDRPPAWWGNLLRDPRATVQVGPRTLQVQAREATADEHAVLWPRLKTVNPFYAQYEQITARRIPVVLLEPRP
ncbi:MAG TPA: nitroreductase/quinone reductase family protein [Candidatus Eisenbacteria bacterium]|nr:nitroreductase/quinone reductase family protein [Candidatus Eisenbacteria bacterium]